MEIKGLYEKISNQNFTLKRVIGNSAAPGAVIEQTKNVLYNNIDAIEEALKYAADAEGQIRVLEQELDDAEREIDELTKAGKKATGKKKPAEGAGE